jgi:hypothetical protein
MGWWLIDLRKSFPVRKHWRAIVVEVERHVEDKGWDDVGDRTLQPISGERKIQDDT